ncbi:MAG: potassium channel family protein [Pyrinomonadaceae bacterium]
MNKALFFSGKIPVLVASSLDAAYFSFVTSVTVGYGDIAVRNDEGKMLTILQILIFLLYGVLFLNFYATRIENRDQPKP